MRLIKPRAELIEQTPGLNGIYKQIELAGRTCYKSEDKITEDSAKPFVDRMINSKHLAMLEHGTIYLEFLCVQPIKVTHSDGTSDIYDDTKIYNTLVNKYIKNPYSKVTERYVGLGGYEVCITTNLRVLVENGWLDDLKYICEPTEYHAKRYTFKVTTSIGVTREFNRHRVNSIAEESTRYCNYSKDKFGGELTFCIPSWMDIPESSAYWTDGSYYRIQPNDSSKETYAIQPNDYFTVEKAMIYSLWLHALEVSESDYMELLKFGQQPQQAREVLPLCTATEAVYTAFESDWKHFFDLRLRGTTGKPHPNMLEIAELMHEQLKQKGIEL